MAILELRAVSRRFGQVQALDDVSLAVEEGEFVCLLGPSGCGKSTALRLVAGFEHPDTGDVRIDDASMLDVPPNRRPTSMVFQSHALWSHMTVFDNIAFGLKLRRMPRATIRSEVAAALELVDLQGLDRRYPQQLSGGQQQRVALARSLVLKPRLLLLDEPFSSLDAHLRIRLRDEVKRIQRRLGLTMLFVTHDQDEALTLADRIVVMNQGRVEQVAAPGEVYDRPQTLFAAGFIGTMNLVPGRYHEPGVVAGPFRIVAPPEQRREFQSTGEIIVAIRPEDLTLRPPSARPEVLGTVCSLARLGAIRTAEVDLDAGPTVKVQLADRVDWARGDRVEIVADRILVFRDGIRPLEFVRPEPSRSVAHRAEVA